MAFLLTSLLRGRRSRAVYVPEDDVDFGGNGTLSPPEETVEKEASWFARINRWLHGYLGTDEDVVVDTGNKTNATKNRHHNLNSSEKKD